MHLEKKLNHDPPFEIVEIFKLKKRNLKLHLLNPYPLSVTLYDNTSGNLFWQVKERILSNNPLVTNRFIAMAQVGHSSHVFITAKDGNLLNHFTTMSLFFKSQLPFLETSRGRISLTVNSSEVSIIEIKKENSSCSIVYHRLK